MYKNQKKVTIITGANRGIGFATAKGLAKEEYQVILTSRTEAKGLEALGKMGNPANVIFHPLNVDDPKSINDLFQFTRKKFGKLDVLINNAGINYDTYHHIANADLKIVRETLETNLIAPWQMIQTFLPLLRNSAAPCIVNVSSGSGAWRSQNGSTPGYSISKLALNGLTMAFANQLRNENILVNAVCPGWVRTDMGGPGAPRSPEKGAETIIWAAQLTDSRQTGKFFRDKQEINW